MSEPVLSPELHEGVLQALREQGITDAPQFEPLGGGGNNRVLRVQAGGRAFALKCYFQHAADPRDRYRAERAFYEYLADAGVRNAPGLIVARDDLRFALFTFIPGRKLAPEEINRAFVERAARFAVEANARRHSERAMAVQHASEACFSIAEHLTCVDRRIDRVGHVEVHEPVDREALAFAQSELKPAWEKMRREILERAHQRHLSPAHTLAPSEICLSPSDFGFHNALWWEERELFFFDFEYAGWDDPAKLACDFFCQPQLPAPIEHWELFVGALGEGLAKHSGSFSARAGLLLPAYQIKWCCIMLNEFLPGDRQRRNFARSGATSTERKRAQLDKSRAGLRRALDLQDCQP
ncbi:MAG: aminoglycoside phosphotransferase family protein [Verrucomicrobiota bacterium]